MRTVIALLIGLVVGACSSGSSGGGDDPESGVATIRWELPVVFTNGNFLNFEDLDAIKVYQVDPRRLEATLSGQSTVHVVSGLDRGDYCFVTTATVGVVESDDSSVVCKRVD